MTSKDDRLIKRLAMEIAARLPNNLAEAIRQFELVTELIETAYADRSAKRATARR